MRKNVKSVRNIVINYVKANGPATWSELHAVVCVAAGQPLNRLNYGSSYIDQVSYGTSACLPTDNDPSYLLKSNFDGLYHYVAE